PPRLRPSRAGWQRRPGAARPAGQPARPASYRLGRVSHAPPFSGSACSMSAPDRRVDEGRRLAIALALLSLGADGLSPLSRRVPPCPLGRGVKTASRSPASNG